MVPLWLRQRHGQKVTVSSVTAAVNGSAEDGRSTRLVHEANMHRVAGRARPAGPRQGGWAERGLRARAAAQQDREHAEGRGPTRPPAARSGSLSEPLSPHRYRHTLPLRDHREDRCTKGAG